MSEFRPRRRAPPERASRAEVAHGVATRDQCSRARRRFSSRRRQGLPVGRILGIVALGLWKSKGKIRRAEVGAVPKKKLISSPQPEKGGLIERLQKQARDSGARKEGFKNFEELILASIAYHKHPSWKRADADTLIGENGSIIKLGETTQAFFSEEVKLKGRKVSGECFVTEKGKPPSTEQTVNWLKKNHPEDVEQILDKYRFKRH
jgi:hypothetical protein